MNPTLVRIALLATVASVVQSGVTQAQSGAVASMNCADEPALKALDFWIGAWVVTDSTKSRLGTNLILKVAEGCAITESWHDPDGTETHGLFYFLPRERRWEMTLVPPAALMPGGLRQRHLVATLPGGGLRFLGEIPVSNGMVLNQMTIEPLPQGRALETIEVSRDGGVTWQRTFTGFYDRQTP